MNVRKPEVFIAESYTRNVDFKMGRLVIYPAIITDSEPSVIKNIHSTGTRAGSWSFRALRHESDCGPLVHIFAILTLF